MIIPKPVSRQSKVALIGPASRIKPEIVNSLIALYADRPDVLPGGELVVYPSALDENASGSYAACLDQRVSDFKDAWGRDDIGLVICARGGYGCVHLLDHLPVDFIAAHPKWLLGFSDVSALHALLWKAGIASIHGGMAKQLVEDENGVSESYRAILRHLVESSHPCMDYTVPGHDYNMPGVGEGILLGGNLAVLNGLAATPFDMLAAPLSEDVILFLEDVSEPIYAVERMLYRLHLQGVLAKAKGIVVGQFTEWKPDLNHDSIYAMMRDRFRDWDISCPVAFDFPVGHTDRNVPLIEGLRVRLEVTSSETHLHS